MDTPTAFEHTLTNLVMRSHRQDVETLVEHDLLRPCFFFEDVVRLLPFITSDEASTIPEDNPVMMAAYGDYGMGYIGTEIAYTQGGYETGPVSRVAPEHELAGLDLSQHGEEGYDLNA